MHIRVSILLLSTVSNMLVMECKLTHLELQLLYHLLCTQCTRQVILVRQHQHRHSMYRGLFQQAVQLTGCQWNLQEVHGT